MAISDNIQEVKQHIDEHDSEEKQTLENLEEMIVDKESRLQEKMAEMEQRIEELEINYHNETLHQEAMSNRLEELEEEIDRRDTVEDFEQRLEELENDVESVADKVNENTAPDIDDRLESLEENVAELTSDMSTLSEALKTQLSQR
jgi:chromosome segregation ATPase